MLYYVKVTGKQATLYSATHAYTCASVRLFNVCKAHGINHVRGTLMEELCSNGQFMLTLTLPMFFRLMGVK